MDIVSLIENAKTKFKDRVAYEYQEEKITFEEVYNRALKVATSISSILKCGGVSIAVVSNKNINIPSVYLGIAYSNCFYIPISSEMPNAKIKSILDLTQTEIIITDGDNLEKLQQLDYSGKIITIEDCINCEIKRDLIDERRSKIIDKNPLYIIFTSGSTGTPKGVVTSHQAVIDYVQTFIDTFNIKEDEVFGNQAPLDYIAGIRDIYIPMIVGCKSIFISKGLFSTPKLLIDYINEKEVTTICWVSPALSLCCQLGVFSEVKPKYVKKVFFTGSVFDYKHLNEWKENLPDAMFVNHYGPTEITASCTYYVVDNNKTYESSVPIGKAFRNRKVFVVNENNKLAEKNEVGEICVVGSCLALGYYKNPEKTNECFVQNVLNPNYPEIMYRTGDVGFLNDNDELIFLGRKDNQIKHMGHRVELEEVESVCLAIENVGEVCCAYNTKKSIIVLFYSGTATPAEISKLLRIKLPSYMIPRKLINLETLPKLDNGKIDRQTIKKQAELI